MDTLGRRREGQHATDLEKRERGCELVIRPAVGRSKKPWRGKTQGGIGAVTWLNPRPACRIRVV
jgi:hypothetical protein